MTNEIPKDIPRKENFSSWVPQVWFEDKEKSSVLLRIYSVMNCATETLINALAEVEKEYLIDKPVRIGAMFGSMKFNTLELKMFSTKDGICSITSNNPEIELPEANYFIIRTPLNENGVEGDYFTAKKRLDVLASLIAAHVGKNLVFKQVFEAPVSAKDGEISNSVVMKVPTFIDGPLLNKENWLDISEILTILTTLSETKRDRINLAITFYYKGATTDEQFFNYWTALEVLCDGTAQAIKQKIKKCYNLESLKVVDKESGFKQIAAWRHDYFHRGKAPQIWTSDIERYMQLLFLDLLRFEAGLPLKGHVSGIISASGYDLSPLGLKDNRTDEQKKPGEFRPLKELSDKDHS